MSASCFCFTARSCPRTVTVSGPAFRVVRSALAFCKLILLLFIEDSEEKRFETILLAFETKLVIEVYAVSA